MSEAAHRTGRPVADAHFAAVVASSDDAILSKDHEGIITTWNAAAERMYGWSADEAIGRPISILIPDSRHGEEVRILNSVFAGRPIEHYETERMRKDGRVFSVSLSVSPVRDEGGEIVSASVIARDVSARVRSRQVAEQLRSVTEALSRALDPERTVQVLLEQAVAGLGANAGTVGLLTSAGDEVELAGYTGYDDGGLDEWRRFPLDSDTPMSAAIRDGTPVWLRDSGEIAERYVDLSTANVRSKSMAVIPLTIEGEAFGALSLSFQQPQEFGDEERAFLLAAAQQAAHALERARLYEAERRAKSRLAFLADASDLLSQSLDTEETMRRLADLAVGRIADWCRIELVTDNGLEQLAVAHRDPERVARAETLRSRYPADPASERGSAAVVRSGVSQLYPEITDEMLVDGAVDEEHLALIREVGMVSVMVVPLPARGRQLGALTLVSSESGRVFSEDDLHLAEELARRAALAIDNARLYRREHDAAVTLQRSLLPQELPQAAGFEFAARYGPAAPGLEVGGDWYEVVRLARGGVGVTIGDVAGRGIPAAAIMGRIRSVLRAYVADGYAPDEALKRLDAVIRESGHPEMATIFHAHVAPDGCVDYVRAGHPPALVRDEFGVRRLAGPGTPPLGILSGVGFASHSELLLPGSMLLLYTDGLIERRGDDLEVGMARLEQLFAEAPDGADACATFLFEQSQAAEVPDDVALLVIRFDPR